MFGEIVPRGSSSKTSTLLLRAGDPLEAKEEYFGTSSVPAARRPFRRNALRSIMLHPTSLLACPLQHCVRTGGNLELRASSIRRRFVQGLRLHALRGLEAVYSFQIIPGQHP